MSRIKQIYLKNILFDQALVLQIHIQFACGLYTKLTYIHLSK